ncbi:hypothetical protein [Halopseudomonas salina]|uniref:Uncharacterized protein n=1 Tax=Halopseudomonas salina TaxID=1323744 RepID=A0ABQ1P9H7_9GAMM|nr:hypothetical protein [Halopseudomonas salina]GGC93241.1 hypothetical protein GCM10007418_10930 [Halopseudomonas salina]
MNILALRERISLAEQHETTQSYLRGWLQERLPTLHPAIAAVDEHDVDAFMGFVSGYIGQVPDVLEAAMGVATQARIGAQLLPVMKVAETFFLQPPDLPADHRGLLALLDEAYLAHRLLEEVNDRYLAHGGGQLVPLDTTRANLIVHHLLEEEFANELDAMVQVAVDGLAPDSVFHGSDFSEYKQRMNVEGKRSLWQEWPCMSAQLGVEIRLRDMP